MAFDRLQLLQRRSALLLARLQRAFRLRERRNQLADALIAALTARGLAREPMVEVAQQRGHPPLLVWAGPRILLAGLGLARQHGVEAANRLVARRETVAQLPLLPLHLGRERRIVLLQLAQAADVGAVGCA